MSKKIIQSTSENKTHANWPDVALRAIDFFYDVINTGNIVGLIVIFFLTYGAVFLWRLPETELLVVLKGLASFLLHEKFYFLPLSILLAFCCFTLKKQESTHKKEIQRLVELRKEILHGIDNGTLKKIEEHSSSGFDLLGEDK
ncbi:MAG: hypothetical protein H7832_05915 [Magnetococcus sp. DMHC-6]